VLHVAQKMFDLESWNFPGVLVSMCSCTPRFFYLFRICRVIAFDLVKICNFQFESCVDQKLFDLVSWNFRKRLISMCSCKLKVLLVYLFKIYRVE
jgi:hypothetical protein